MLFCLPRVYAFAMSITVCYRTISAGAMFLLGDNRDNSMDSRFPALPAGGVGFVGQDRLVGQAGAVLWSTDGTATWLDPSSWLSALRRDRTGQAL